MWGLTSRADAAPSCAASMNLDGEGLVKSEGRALASKLSTIPFSNETYLISKKGSVNNY